MAWGENHEFAYHSPGRRATGWLNFFDLPKPENTAGLLTHEVRGNTLQVPVDKTVYCYSGHKLPQDKKYHVVRAEAFLNSSHPQLVHHMILYTCLQDLDETFYNQTQTGPPVCAVGMKQKGMCYSFWILWAVGGNAMQMPNEAGMPMGLATIPGDVRLSFRTPPVVFLSEPLPSSFFPNPSLCLSFQTPPFHLPPHPSFPPSSYSLSLPPLFFYLPFISLPCSDAC